MAFDLIASALLDRRLAPAGAEPAAPRRPGPVARALGVASRAVAPRAISVLAAALVPALLIGLWQLSAERAWVSTLVLPAPGDVLATFRELWADGTILANLEVSAGRVARGFVLGAGGGLVAGAALGLSPAVRAYVRPTFMALYQVNVLAWIPLLILVFGIDEPLKTAVIAWSSALPVIVNTMQGIAGIPPRWFELARVSQLGRGAVLRRIVIPAALPSLFTGLRSGLGAAWMSLVVVELVASSEGVGFMVVWGRQLFQLDVVLAAIVVIGLVGLALDLVLSGLERRLRGWHRAAL
jgi:sulfonate transport system permease protein